MDYSTSEGLSISLLGESNPGHVGGAIHGWGGDLRGCGLCPLSGKSAQASVLSCAATATLIAASGGLIIHSVPPLGGHYFYME